MKVYKKAWEKIENTNSILLLSHKRPDGDTLGSVLALYEVLKGLGKHVYIYNPSKLPTRFAFLPNVKKVKNTLPKKECDIAIICDCGSLDRVGLAKPNYLINLDHHDTNEGFGDINIIKPDYASASMVVYELLKQNKVKINKNTATCLYVGFVEDTGFFSYGNIGDKALEMVLDLSRCGLDMQEVSRELREKKPLFQVRLMAHIYGEFYLKENATVGIVHISQEDLKRIGCSLDETKNVITPIRELATVQLAVMVAQRDDGGAKISLRSKGLDVSSIALAFGGGGHKKAAGFECETYEPEAIVEKILTLYRKCK